MNLDSGVVTRSMRSRMAEEQEGQRIMAVRRVCPAEHPLENDVIVAGILSYVPSNELAQLRHVNSVWSRQVLTSMWSRGENLEYIILTSIQYVQGSQCICSYPEPTVQLDLEQIEGVAAGTPVPFSLTCSKLFWTNGNKSGLAPFLARYGPGGMTELEISIDKDHFSFAYLTTPSDGLRFWRLHRLHVIMVGYEPVNSEDTVPYEMTSFFHACSELEEIKLGSWMCGRPGLPRSVFSLLPATLTKLYVNWDMDAPALTVLASSNLPQLKDLALGRLCFSDELDDNLFNKLLSNFSNSLESFVLRAEPLPPYPQPALIVFPRMKKLQLFQIMSSFIQVDHDTGKLDELLPNLRILHLDHQSVQSFQILCAKPWSLVEALHLSLINIDGTELTGNFYLPLGLPEIQAIRRGFPGLTALFLDLFQESDVSSLAVVFENLRQLRQLFIQTTQVQMTTELMTSALLGVPLEALKAFGILRRQELTGYLDSFPNYCPGSIVHMQALGTLDFKGIGYEISDDVFLFGLFKMPRLFRLTFHGTFTVSEHVKREWCDRGREIIWEDEDEETNPDWEDDWEWEYDSDLLESESESVDDDI